MALWQTYLRPKKISDALQALATAPKPLALIAGGTDLMLDLKQGRRAPVHTLLDVSEIEELLALEIRGEQLFIGAGVNVNRIASDGLILRRAQALTEASTLIAGPQVRNVATLGGNVAHALPAADGTIALLALNARAEIAALHGTRLLPLAELFLGAGKSALQSGEEILVGFHLPLAAARQASCFKRIMRPQGVALPILNCAVWLERAGDTMQEIRIAIGPGAPTPYRAMETEKLLAGKPMNAETMQLAQESILAHVGFRSSPRRASADYRRHLIEGLFKDVLQAAWERAA
ncbi:MAG: xanthine dehydrogenase family protein subunit M [Anaerolineales bacterium]